MKLASYKEGRDGHLMVVSRDLQRAVSASGIAPTLQAALDDWAGTAPQLAALSDRLNRGELPSEAFVPERCAAPLPRAYSWTDGSVFINHTRLMARSIPGQLALLEEREKSVLMYQGGSDTFLGPRDDIVFPDAANWGVDFEGEYAVITDDVPMGVGKEAALDHVKLLALINDISLRNLLPPELRINFGLLVGKPSSAFAPVVVTPDELGDGWAEGKIRMTMLCHRNGELIGRLATGDGMCFDFSDLIAHVTTSRALGAGAIIGSGTVSNEVDLDRFEVSRGGPGYSCIAEARVVEILREGEPKTSFLEPSERIRIEIVDDLGRSVFGAIEQTFRQGS